MPRRPALPPDPDLLDDDANAAPDAGASSASSAYDRPSKSQRKRDSHALQDLGEALVELPAARIAAIEMPDSLREAVLAYLRTRSHEGRRRQMQLVGRLMRSADVEPIRTAVDAHARGLAVDSLALHRAERWRAELIASDDALTEWLAAHPDADAQQLRTLVRNARKESRSDGASVPAGVAPRKGRAFRDLFQFIREAERG